MTMDMKEALAQFSRRRTDELVVVPFTGGLAWQDLSDRPTLDLPFWGAMGKASSTGLGLALAVPDRRVWVLDGDGSLVMNLGSLITIANMAQRNLVHVVLENGVYATTGGQPIPGSGRVDFVGLARSAGFPRTYAFKNESDLESGLDEALFGDGPTFISVRVRPVALPYGSASTRLPRRRTPQAAMEMRRELAHD